MQNPSSPKSLTFQCSLGFLPISWTFLLYPVPTVGEFRVRHSACCSLCAKFHFYDSVWSLSPNLTILVMIPIPIFCPDLPCISRLYVQIHLKCLVVVVVFSLNVPQMESSPSLLFSRSILLFIWVISPVSTQCPRLGIFFDPFLLILQHQAVVVLPSPPPPPPPPSSYFYPGSLIGFISQTEPHLPSTAKLLFKSANISHPHY